MAAIAPCKSRRDAPCTMYERTLTREPLRRNDVEIKKKKTKNSPNLIKREIRVDLMKFGDVRVRPPNAT